MEKKSLSLSSNTAKSIKIIIYALCKGQAIQADVGVELCLCLENLQ